jgi:hypothetical protein
MRNGEQFDCWRPDCQLPGVPISTGVLWDLGHVEDPVLRARYGPRWPEHRRCNRSTLTHAKAGSPGTVRLAKSSRNGDGPKPAPRVIAQKIRFGDVADLELARRLMDDSAGAVERWSCHWHGGFDLRCPECRRTGEPCADALANTAAAF